MTPSLFRLVAIRAAAFWATLVAIPVAGIFAIAFLPVRGRLGNFLFFWPQRVLGTEGYCLRVARSVEVLLAPWSVVAHCVAWTVLAVLVAFLLRNQRVWVTVALTLPIALPVFNFVQSVLFWFGFQLMVDGI
ncbi:MAG: hypothetical protein AAAFM81_14665 [Pseudomonadota bacterium]